MSKQDTLALQATITPEFNKVNREEPAETHVLVSLRGRQSQEGEERKPIRIIAAVDCSGSMAGKKIDFLRASMRALVRQLTSRDYLGIVAFSSSTWVVAEPTLCDEVGRESLYAQIDNLRPSSLTNLSGGATEAITMLRNLDVNRKETIDRVFLLTDGEPTTGVTKDDDIVTLIKKTAGVDIDITTFGYGEDSGDLYLNTSYNPKLLEAISRACRGNFHHIPNPDAVPKALGSELGGLMTTVAQNIKIFFKLKDNVSVVEVLNDLDVMCDRYHHNTCISVDDIYIEEEKSVVARLKLPAFNKAAGARPNKNLGDVIVSWLDVRTGQVEEQVIPFKLAFVKPGEEDKASHPQVEKRVALLKAANAQREAVEKANQGQFGEARHLLQSAAKSMRACGLFDNDDELQHVVKAYEASLDDYQPNTYTSSVALQGASMARCMFVQRDMSGGIMAQTYGTSATRGMSDSMASLVRHEHQDEMEKATELVKNADKMRSLRTVIANDGNDIVRPIVPDHENDIVWTGPDLGQSFNNLHTYPVARPDEPGLLGSVTGYTKRRSRR